MRMPAAFALVMCLAACQSAKPGATQSAKPRATPPDPAAAAAERQRSEQRRLIRAGFEPLAALSARRLEVQRVDPMWDLLDYPSLELTRDAAGRVAFTLRFQGHERRQSVPPQIWEQLATRARDAFTPADSRALRRRGRQIRICHSWHELEALIDARELRITASPCMGDLQRDALFYVDALARAALDNIPLCEPDRDLADIRGALLACGRRLGPPTEAYRQQRRE